jgi:hypothetical protein
MMDLAGGATFVQNLIRHLRIQFSMHFPPLVEVPVVALIRLRHGKRVETVASNFLDLTKRSSTSCRGQDSWYTHTKAMQVKA